MKEKKKSFIKRLVVGCLVVIGLMAAAVVIYIASSRIKWVKDGVPDYVQTDLLYRNPKSRPGTKLTEVNNIVIHYVANPGSSAKANRNYFNNLALPFVNKANVSASSHLIVGLSGEVIQCVPLTEVAYANYPRNYDTISIEVCHPDETGRFSEETYETVVDLTARLLKAYGLTPEQVIRHHDVSGKNCPKYYVENEEAWEQLINDITERWESL